MDVRFIVTNIQGLSDQVLNDEIYCARGQAKNWIKEHKLYLSSDRTSCHQWQAKQYRLFLHTAAYWLLYQVRETLAQTARLKSVSLESLRRALIKVALRVSELKSRGISIQLSQPKRPAPAVLNHGSLTLTSAATNTVPSSQARSTLNLPRLEAAQHKTSRHTPIASGVWRTHTRAREKTAKIKRPHE